MCEIIKLHNTTGVMFEFPTAMTVAKQRPKHENEKNRYYLEVPSLRRRKCAGLTTASIEHMVDSNWLEKLQRDTNGLTKALATHHLQPRQTIFSLTFAKLLDNYQKQKR